MEVIRMKLNNKRTILVGLAFLSICAFWQMYDNIVPLILTNTFHLNETFSGAIMAADNVLALFLLPIFGGISDRTNTKIGKRMPFILFGTGCAVILVNILPLLDNSYAAAPSTFKLVSFVIVLGLLLVAMGTYRSPAVALMPDVTPKPLRSKGNAIINLMGAVGGIIYLAVAAVMYPNSKVQGLSHVNYQPLFMVVAAIMFVSIAVLFLTVKEPELVEENKKLEKEHPEWDLAQDDGSGNEVLPVPVKRSLGFLLASIALWFAGYNGVTTWFTTYISVVMGEGLGGASTCLLVATAGAIVSYIPIGALASKIGRKRTIMGGIVLLAVCFLLGYVLTTVYTSINLIMYIVFAIVGLAWAAINVNSLPMVVEMCKGSDIGKFTGYYYTASMSAQIVTPILAGTLMRHIDYRILFPYAALFVSLSFVTMVFVRHGDAKVEAKRGLEAFEDMDD
jgi:MFS family permease